jgi:flagellar biosynthesis/type III secretory pathway M-ring protein FliF/YscJ
MIQTGIKYGSLVLAALLLILFVVRPAQKALKASQSPEQKLLPESTAAAALTGATTEIREAVLAERRENALEAPKTEATTVAQLLSDTTPRTVAELEARMEAKMDGKMNAQPHVEKKSRAKMPLPEDPELDPMSSQALRERLGIRSAEDPELIAMTLRSWLQDNR